MNQQKIQMIFETLRLPRLLTKIDITLIVSIIIFKWFILGYSVTETKYKILDQLLI